MNYLFGWRRLARLTFMLLYFVIDVLCASQQTVQSATQQVKGILGQSLTFPERVFKNGYLRYGEDTNACVLNGQSQIDPEERFKNRLHWDNVTGLFRLSDVQIEDAGVYSVENKDGGKRTLKFNLTLYSVVSKPQVTECDNSSCSVVCSVDNEKEVTLTLYLGEEKLNQTSSRDLTTNLRLEVEGKDYNSAYSCVAANPVSNKTALVPKCCSEDGHHKQTDSDEMTRGMLIIAVICVLVVLGLVGLAIYLKKRGNEHSQGRYLSFRGVRSVKTCHNQLFFKSRILEKVGTVCLNTGCRSNKVAHFLCLVRQCYYLRPV
ncbi:SLAM family member 5-like [Coregonus clupeaformis]|uniref:SLAM family member 5-like n=1 Tax=Coregonus clupeaformis TaxID=59861 RepID=UPI001E1C5C4E|nr:SLAM family member 5-like [Coregonus clupeaformis]